MEALPFAVPPLPNIIVPGGSGSAIYDTPPPLPNIQLSGYSGIYDAFSNYDKILKIPLSSVPLPPLPIPLPQTPGPLPPTKTPIPGPLPTTPLVPAKYPDYRYLIPVFILVILAIVGFVLYKKRA